MSFDFEKWWNYERDFGGLRKAMVGKGNKALAKYAVDAALKYGAQNSIDNTPKVKIPSACGNCAIFAGCHFMWGDKSCLRRLGRYINH